MQGGPKHKRGPASVQGPQAYAHASKSATQACNRACGRAGAAQAGVAHERVWPNMHVA